MNENMERRSKQRRKELEARYPWIFKMSYQELNAVIAELEEQFDTIQMSVKEAKVNRHMFEILSKARDEVYRSRLNA
jgi:hypothetical protein